MTVRLTQRCAIYVRVSTLGQEEGASRETQESSCLAYASDHGLEIVQVITETGSGGTIDGRPKLSQLRTMIAAGAVDIVLVHALDRLSRDVIERSVLKYECARIGATIVSATERTDDSFEGMIVETVLALSAARERQLIGERTQRGIRARVEGTKDGTQRPTVGKKPPYGYVWGGDRKSKLIEEPESADIVRRIFQEAANGSAMLAIANRLTADGIPTPAGELKPWQQQTIALMLDNPVYIGQFHAFRNRVETSKKLNRNGKPTRTVSRRPDSETKLIEGAAPAIVDRTVYQLAQEQRALRASCTTTRRNREEEALLRGGYLRCAHCGGPMTTAVHHGKVIYRCGQKFRKLTDCPAVSVRAEVIDPMIWSLAQRVVSHPLQIEFDAERLTSESAQQAERQQIEKRIADKEGQRSRIVRAIGRAQSDEAVDQLTTELDSLAKEIRALKQERDASIEIGQIGAGLDPDALLAAWFDRLEKMREQVRPATYDYATKRQLLAMLGISATIHRTFRKPGNMQEAGQMLANSPYTVSARISLMDAGPWPELQPLSTHQLGVLGQRIPTNCC